MSTISRIWGRFPAAPTLLLPCLGRAAGRLGAIRFPGALSWLLVSAFLTGCAVVPSHIHDDTNAQTAKKAEDAMAAFSSNAPAIYGAMSANLELFKAEEDYVTSELGAVHETALATKLPSMTWGKLRTEIGAQTTNVALFADQVAREAKSFQESSQDLRAKLQDVNRALAAARAKVTAAKAAVAAWNATVGAFQLGIAKSAENLSAAKQGATLELLASLEANVGTNQVKYSDANGRATNQTVSAILGNTARGIVSAITAHGTNSPGRTLFPDAPGIGLVMANLTLDIVQARKNLAEQQRSQLTARANLLEDAYAAMRLASQFLKEAEQTLSPASYPDHQNIFVEATDSWADGRRLTEALQNKSYVQTNAPGTATYGGNLLSAENGIADALVVIRKTVIAESIVMRNRAQFPLTLARLEHQNSIADSAIADAAQRALFQSALAGLSAYHQGGATKEDLANLFRFAEAAALAAIAWQVN
ncbi:MAG: hypothetical protein WCK27_22955 [Verrucomicrobiota bacterium]